MRPRLLRHSLGGGRDAATIFRSLYAGRSDVFWLDSGTEGTSYVGAGRPLALERPVLAALERELGSVASEGEGTVEGEGDAPLFRLGLVGWLGYELRGETTGIEP